MDPATLRIIAISTLPTGLAALLVLLAVWWKSPRRRTAPGTPVRTPGVMAQTAPLLLVVLCATALYPLTFQAALPGFPPERGRHAVAFVGLAMLPLGLLWIGAGWLTCVQRNIARAVLVFAAFGVALGLTLGRQLSAPEGLGRWWGPAAGFAVLGVVFTLGLVGLAGRPGLSRVIAVFVALFAVSQTLVLGYHSISEGTMAAALCAVVGGVAVTAFLRPHAVLGGAAAFALCVTGAALMLQGAAFGVSDMPWRLVFGVLLAVSPGAAMLAERVSERAGVTRGWVRGVWMVAGAALPAMAAVALAGRLYLADTGEY